MKQIFDRALNLGKRLIQVECRHYKGRGICHPGGDTNILDSCGTCLEAANLSEKLQHYNKVKCAVCDGRGVFFYLPPAKPPTLNSNDYRVVELQRIAIHGQIDSSANTVRLEGPAPAPRLEGPDES